MENNNDKFQDAHQLADDELTDISGGYWSGYREDGARGFYESEKRFGRTDAATFEDFLEERYSQTLNDRQAWIAAGSPNDDTYYYAK